MDYTVIDTKTGKYAVVNSRKLVSQFTDEALENEPEPEKAYYKLKYMSLNTIFAEESTETHVNGRFIVLSHSKGKSSRLNDGEKIETCEITGYNLKLELEF